MRPSALDLVPAAQLSSLMDVDSLSPPLSDLSPLLPTPTPHALDFTATVTRPPPMTPPVPTPQPCPPSSPSLLAVSSGTKEKRSRALAHKSTGGCGPKKCPLDPLSPSYNSPHDAQAILVPSSEPGQRWTQPSLVAYRAALHDLWVHTRIDAAEERELADEATLLCLRQPGDLNQAFCMLALAGVVAPHLCHPT